MASKLDTRRRTLAGQSWVFFSECCEGRMEECFRWLDRRSHVLQIQFWRSIHHWAYDRRTPDTGRTTFVQHQRLFTIRGVAYVRQAYAARKFGRKSTTSTNMSYNLSKFDLIARISTVRYYWANVYLLSDVQLVPSPGELLLNIRPCLILAHWPHGMKHNVIHKTESTWRITKPSEEVRATTNGNIHKKLGEVLTCGFWDILAYRQTDTHTDMLSTILRFSAGGVGDKVINMQKNWTETVRTA